MMAHQQNGPLEARCRSSYHSVTLWHSIEDALTALDAFVDTPEPRGTLDERLIRPDVAPRAKPGGAVRSGNAASAGMGGWQSDVSPNPDG